MKTKRLFGTLILVVLLFCTAAIIYAKLGGKIDFNNSSAKVTAMCNLSYVDFKASNGKIYPATVSRSIVGGQSCTYKISNVPSGTKGVLRAKLTLYSQNTHIRTCWSSQKSITPTLLSGAINITSGWSNHPDSLYGTGECQRIQ
jgi:hypothetical protein